jgi:hypothetical protein
MKALVIAAAGFLALSLPSFAQTTPTSNATSLGTATTAGNSAGAPQASTPQGQLSTTGGAPPVGGSSPVGGGTVPKATTPSADSAVTGTSTQAVKQP